MFHRQANQRHQVRFSPVVSKHFWAGFVLKARHSGEYDAYILALSPVHIQRLLIGFSRCLLLHSNNLRAWISPIPLWFAAICYMASERISLSLIRKTYSFEVTLHILKIPTSWASFISCGFFHHILVQFLILVNSIINDLKWKYLSS